MSVENTIYYITQENINDKDILFHDIYSNEKCNYYFSDDFSKDFYIHLACCGFISTSTFNDDKLYLLPEMQFEYSILDFENLHISKKVKKLLKKCDYKFTINKKFDEVLEKIETYHNPNWLIGEYKTLAKELHTYKPSWIEFEFLSIELSNKETNELVAAEIGYKINNTYTSLTGFSSK